MTHAERVPKYAEDVTSGAVLACRYVKLACQRHLDDLKRSKKASYPYVFDEKKANRVCKFIELLPHTKGKWAISKPGQPRSNLIRLEDWQIFTVGSVFGWVRKADGLRRFRLWYEEVPRKNAKSTKAAAVGLYMLAADGEMGAEVYSGATSEKQAWEVFRPAKLMAERTPEFLEHYGVEANSSNLHIIATGSRFVPVIAKPGDGASPSLAIVDEYHEHPDDTLFDTMQTGMGAREQPLMLAITTAGSDIGGPCYALRSGVVKMLEGTVPNDELFGIIYGLDKEDDWTTEAALRKANPNYDISVSGEFLRQQQRDAINSSRKQNIFKMKHANVWVTARESWMNMEHWYRQADAPPLETFAKEPAFVGLDLASKIDLTAGVRVFRRDVDGVQHFYVFSRFWLPDAQLEDPEKAHFAGWHHDGWITATSGNVIDYAQVRTDLLEDDATFGIAQLGYDPFGAEQLAQELGVLGVEIVEVPQRVAYLSEPMKWVEALVKDGRLHHDGNPVLDWCVSNVTARPDAKENIFPRKERPENKIDGAVALIIAMSRATVAEEEGFTPRFRVVGSG